MKNYISSFAKNKKYSVLVILGKGVLIIVFCIAFIGKIFDPDPSILFIENIFNIGTTLSKIALAITISFEAFIVLSLVLFNKSKWPYYLTGTTLILFSGILAYALLTNLELSCGCFGPIIKQNGLNQYSLMKDLLLAILAFMLPYQK